ncbi:hypothetical protein BDV33DRAFT_181479 [Aspergillus novoparasiticus]|uniref:Uncharacterized protein n=1 Tax=Aspergillus novoparasiticus TaxID=986946 RepID=A0A5N6EE73_9EURO|nr:hypothetical protein BDV33DRAFT_181479 [Aspergillus novoparasiticus]
MLLTFSNRCKRAANMSITILTKIVPKVFAGDRNPTAEDDDALRYGFARWAYDEAKEKEL